MMRGPLLAQLTLLLCLVAGLPALAGPNLQGPSGLILLPTAPVESGVGMHTEDGQRTYKYNIALPGGRLEAGVVRRNDGGDRAYHAKLALLQAGWLTPALSLGVWDLSHPERDPSHYLVGSRSFGMIGLTLHAGLLHRGRIRSLAALRNANNPLALFADRSRSRSLGFFAAEYALLPLVSLMGEYLDESINLGIRFRPTEGVTIDWDYLDIRNRLDLKDRRLMNLKYHLRF